MAVVAVDRALPGLDVDVLTLDDDAAAARATRALYDRGHRLVACVTGSADARTAGLRAQGWREVVTKRSPCAEPSLYLRHTDYRAAGGRRAAADLLALPEPPDAIFAANNMLGVGVLAHLADAGLSPPAVGVAVLGDLPWPAWEAREVAVQPWPGRLLGVTAAEVLLGRIRGDTSPARTLVLRSDCPEAPAAVTA
jgi:LacI family transcriptional regulator